MNESDLQRLVAAAVRAVLAELSAAPASPAGPLVRVLLADTTRGADFALAAVKTLAAHGVRLEYVVTSGETSQLSPAYLRELPGTVAAVTAAEAGCPRAFARGADAVVAAALDRPSAVKLALTMAEGFADKFLLEALRLAKPVVIATDGFLFSAPDATPQLRQVLAEPAARLETFGAVLAPAAELLPALELGLAPLLRPAPASRRRVVTVDDVEAATGALVLPRDAVVTPLAVERAAELGVDLRRASD